METGYNKNEALNIQTLPWYQDCQLNNMVLELLQQHKGCRKLVDLCCGPSILASSYLDMFDSYIGVDKSAHMIHEAVVRVDSQSNAHKATLYEADIYDFIDKQLLSANPSHILIKNAMQFFEFQEIMKRISCNINSSVAVVIVQTVKHKDNDIFNFLPQMDFKARIRRFYTRESILSVVDLFRSSENIVREYIQNICVEEWLKYHGVDYDNISLSLQKLKSLNNEELESHGLSLSNGSLHIKRALIGCTFVVRPAI